MGRFALSGPGRVVAVLAATLAGALLVAAVVLPRVGSGSGEPPTGTVGAMPSGSAPVTPGASGSPGLPGSSGPAGAPGAGGPSAPVGASAATPPAPVAAAAPTRVAVPRLGIDLPVQPEGVNDAGEMALPATPDVVGWYRFGSAPDDPTGATVLAAHVDSKERGIGPFVRLGTARTGDEVVVWTGDRSRTYRVTQVSRVDKATLDADGLFSVSGAPRVHLVTCTGAYLSGSGYEQNLVVVAEPR